MPTANGMVIGNDLSLVIQSQVSGLLSFNNITSSNIKQVVQKLKSVGLDGNVRYATLPEGWVWDIMLDAGDGRLMDYFAVANGAFVNQGKTDLISLTQTVQWTQTNTGVYTYTGGAATLTDAGKFTGNEKVTQSLTIEFSKVIKRQ
jgi:hypothetical protein